jgi:micrococcal nuclease
MKHSLYNYKAKVISVYDDDTCTVDIDLGLNTWIRGNN